MKKDTYQGKKKAIDAIDCQMIRLLQKDGRISNTEIAKQIGISEATVRTRLNRLIREADNSVPLDRINPPRASRTSRASRTPGSTCLMGTVFMGP